MPNQEVSQRGDHRPSAAGVELHAPHIVRDAAILLSALNLRQQRGAEDRLAAPMGYQALAPGAAKSIERQIGPVVVGVSASSKGALVDLQKAEMAYRMAPDNSPERSAAFASLQKKLFAFTISAAQSALVMVSTDSAAVTDGCLATIKGVLKECQSPPLNLKRVVIAEDLGQWRSPSGETTPIHGLSISPDGVLKISATAANNPALCKKILGRAIAIESRLGNEALDYADSAASMCTGVASQPGFRTSGKGEPGIGFLPAGDKEYPVLLPNAGHVIGTIYPGFSGDAQQCKNKAFFVDRDDPNLNGLYDRLKGLFTTLPADLSDIDKALIASALVRTMLEPQLESKMSGLPREVTVPLGVYLNPEIGKGECRQLAVTLSYLLERMIEDRFIGGSFRFIANFSRSVSDGHAAVEYRSSSGTAVICDPTHSRFLPADFVEARTCAEEGAWSYRSPEEINKLRGQPLWMA